MPHLQIRVAECDVLEHLGFCEIILEKENRNSEWVVYLQECKYKKDQGTLSNSDNNKNNNKH